MPEAPKCPQCGEPLPSGGWEGLCPKCLVRVSLETQSREANPERGSPEPQYSKLATGDPISNEASGPAATVDTRASTLRSFGDYELLEEIARGGMGIVYKARQVTLNRLVAVKMILSGEFASPGYVERFKREAEAAANLHHPNIVAIHEVGVQDGQHYFSMDYVEGRNFAELVRDGPLPARQAAGYLKTIAEAIHYAHQRGILHRDLKPSNVLIDPNDEPRITDFGLAKRLTDSQLSTLNPQLTLTGEVLGSPNYMPPEQARGTRQAATVANDVYSLGAILYHLMTGRPPFAGETLTATLHELLHSEPVSPRLLNTRVPRDLETICLKCLSKEPQRRYATARELADELARFLRDEPILARPIGPHGKAWRWCRRNPRLASLAGVSLLLLLAVAIGSPIAALRISREKRSAQSNAAESRARLVRQYVANGNRLVDEGDLMGALPWFATALKEEQDPARAEIHRLRLGTTLKQCPRLAQVWFNKDVVRDARFSPDGRRVLTLNDDRTARVWDAMTGEAVSTPFDYSGGTFAFSRDAAFSPDGRRLATVSGASSVGVWDVETGRLAFPVLQHDGGLFHIEFSPDGRLLATGSSDCTAQLWDAATGARIGQPMKHETSVTWVSFSPDGSRLVTATAMVAIWRVPTGELVTRLRMAENRSASYCQFSPDSSRVAIACGDGTAWVFDAATGNVVTLIRHQGRVRRACFSPDGRWLLTASEDGTAGIWNAATGTPVSATIRHAGPIVDSSFSSDGRLVVTASSDGTAGLWFASTGKPATTRLKHAAAVLSACFSTDGQRIVTASHDHTARLWDLRGASQAFFTMNHPAVVQRASFSPDNRRVVTVSVDGTAHVSDLRTGEPFTAMESNLEAVRHAEFSPDGRLLAAASSNGTARVWDLSTGQPVSPPLVHTGLVNHVDFSPDGKMVVTAGSDRFARVWVVSSGRLISEMKHRESVNYAWFTRDGKQVVTLYVSVPDFYPVERWGFHLAEREEITLSDATEFWPDPKWSFGLAEREAITAIWAQAQIWDAATGQPVSPPRKLGTSVSQVAICPDRQRIIPFCSGATLAGKEVRVIDLVSDQRLALPFHHDKGIIHASFSPNGRWAVTASWDKTARVWDTTTGQPVGPWLTHPKTVYHASFSPDGRLVATASEDQTARVWDATTGEPVTPALKHHAAVHRVFFSPNGRWLLTASVDGRVRVWELPRRTQPVEAEQAWAEFLAGHRIDDTGAVLPVSPEAMQRAWLKWQAPASLGGGTPPAPMFARHRQEGGTGDNDPPPETHPATSPAHDYIRRSLLIVNKFKLQDGSSAHSSNEWAEAVQEFSKVIEVEPDAGSLNYFWRARGYERLGQYQKAIADCRESIWRGAPGESSSGYARDYLTRGQCYLRLGEFEKAEADFQTVMELSPDDVTSCNNLAWFYATGPTNCRSPQKALSLALKAVELGRTNYTELNTLGVVYYRLGQWTNAIATLETGIKTDKAGGSAHDFFFLAMSYQRLGRSAQAQDYFAKALEWWEHQTNPPSGDAELLAFRAEAEEVLGKRKAN